jgi:methionyl-tRNA formyltransferase
MRIVFFGTPDFAVATLKALVENGLNVVAVVTAPDKPAGRGMKLQMPAVKKYAADQHLPVLQPEKLKDAEFIAALRSYQADVQVVVAFRMLPEMVWNMPLHGTINLHASLLPQYRGAAPINWAIIRGELQTGVTTFRLQHAIDTGNILMQQRVDIDPQETAGTLHDKLMTVGANLMVKTLQGIENNSITEMPQQTTDELKSAPKIFTETCRIVWDQPAVIILNFIRGLSPYPAAFSTLHGKKIKIYDAEAEVFAHTFLPGMVQSDQKTFLKFACTDGFILVKELQLEGKTKMKVEDFLRGYRMEK